MSDNQVCSGRKRRFHIQNFNETVLAFLKWSFLSLAVVSIFLSLSLIRVGATPSSWAQCGTDSYVECSGGTRCTSTDNRGCACYDSAGRVVDKHSCSEAAPESFNLRDL